MRLTEIKQGRSLKDIDIEVDAQGNFICHSNRLTSLEGAPSSVGGAFYCSDNQLTSLEGIHLQIKKIGGKFYCIDTRLKSHVLGLLLIKGLTRAELDDTRVEAVLNKHLPSRGMRDVLEAQEELIEAGLEEFAQL